MEDAEIRKYAEAHGDAVARGDQAHLMADIVPEALGGLGPVAAALPQPVTGAEVQSIDVTGDKAVVRIAYSGADKTIVVESQWEPRDGRPKIVAASVV